MVIEWGSILVEHPDLEFAKPVVSDEMKIRASSNYAVPAHCKPWLDAQSCGLVVVWPYETTHIILTPNLRKVMDDTLVADPSTVRWEPPTALISNFAHKHFSLTPNYVFRTPQGVGLYVTELPDGYKSPLRDLVVRGVLETSWYPAPPFFVFRIPFVYSPDTITLNYGDPLCMLVPIMLNASASKMTNEQVLNQMEEHDHYRELAMSEDDMLWFTADGKGFSHIYKRKSREHEST